jgi:phenylacetic acid degradation operon negative regulatory protein
MTSDRRDGATDPTEIRALNARSLALSALLGTHPPALPTRSLVDLAELFGIAGGTMRTALSRMAANGEVTASNGRHQLTGRLLERQRAQDVGRQAPAGHWDGRWHTVIAAADQRELADRRQFRATLGDHRFGELRPDIWMRPANLPVPPVDAIADAIVVTGTIARIDEPDLVGRLWGLDSLAAAAERLIARIDALRDELDLTTPDAIPATFTLAAGILRFLRSEPMLPPALTPDPWPVTELRRRYGDLERDLQRTLRDFLSRAPRA